MIRKKGIIYTITSSVAFGILPIFVMLAYDAGMSVSTMLFLTALVATITLYVYLKINRIPFTINLKQVRILTIIAVFGNFATSLFLYLAYERIGVGITTAIHFSYPAIVTALAVIFYREKLNFKKAISLLISIMGICILSFEPKMNLNVLGIIFAILSAFSFSSYIFGFANIEVKKLNSVVSIFYMCSISSIFGLVYGLIQQDQFMIMSKSGFGYVFIISVFLTALPFVLLSKGVGILGSITAAIISTSEPIIGIALGVIILNETITTFTVTGSVLVIISVLVTAFSTSNENDESDVFIDNQAIK
ncbi:EamA domain-containing membrane protein RarD [Dethiosulfatibacter aminovorans DSM 17477]|uniref:EamA domain-containing membrane protein RarD n=1 Tax=Dethiosulfatibacter aminovorans DSM 17477 TaxID=1121476 RepID=A0A1M6MQE6_9FIRM|nr:DMT family transporter [Dethiosulfatibacter aminovorans]SHJ85664.1 EamA domain-containing membrane protein RarD [Dethiosulfatibacter aminovorans DSM 17477]